MYKKLKALICSPLRADTPEGIQENMRRAREYASDVSEQFNCRAIAIHGVLPDICDDDDPVERQLALEFGIKFLTTCDMLVVCGDIITKGMEGEITTAMRLGKPIYIYADNRFFYVVDKRFSNGRLKGVPAQSKRMKGFPNAGFITVVPGRKAAESMKGIDIYEMYIRKDNIS